MLRDSALVFIVSFVIYRKVSFSPVSLVARLDFEFPFLRSPHAGAVHNFCFRFPDKPVFEYSGEWTKTRLVSVTVAELLFHYEYVMTLS